MHTRIGRSSAYSRLVREVFTTHQAHPVASLRSMTAAQTVPGSVHQAPPSTLLTAVEDKFDGLVIDANQLPADVDTFTDRLKRSLQAWSAAGKRGIWLKVPISAVQLVEPAVRLGGFTPHHAEPSHIMLVKWLPDTPNTLPPNASHQVGIGAIVFNSRQELLVVQERNGPLRGTGVWKMPTGLVHEGEDLHTGAEREVLEETGIRARFDCLLAMRQAHGLAFGKSDLFMLVGLVPEEGQGEVTPTPQESEVVGARWMPLDEYLSQPFTQGLPLFDKLRDRVTAYAQGRYQGWQGATLEAGFASKRQDLLFWGNDSHQPQHPSAL